MPPKGSKSDRGNNSKHGKGRRKSSENKTKQVTVKNKDKKPANPWAYKVILPNLSEHDKCNITDLSILECRSQFSIKLV